MQGGAVATALTGDQVKKLSGGAKVLRYPDLASMGSWSELVSPSGKAAILFCTDSPTDGHWIAAFDGPDGPHVFDPLGVALDAERKYLAAGMAEALGEQNAQFARLLSTQPDKVHVSKIDFQADKPGVNTCGRWSGLRLSKKDWTDPEFAGFVKDGMAANPGLSADEWIVQATR